MPMPITIVNNNNQQLLCALYCTCLIDCQFLFLRGGGGGCGLAPVEIR